MSNRFRPFHTIVLISVIGIQSSCTKVADQSQEPDLAEEVTTTYSSPYIIVLGTAQDGGSPQAGSHGHPGWTNPDERRLVVSLGLVSPINGKRWIFEATPDFRDQWYELAKEIPGPETDNIRQVPDGIFLTHAHIGHYTGLMFLGHESMGTQGVPVYCMPRMAEFLTNNGPWSQLVRYENISLNVLENGTTIDLTDSLRVAAVQVPHRQEFSEVAAFRIEGPNKTAFFLPDIDSWEEWDSLGIRIEDILHSVDLAFLDATFFDNGEIPGRDMSTFPHPKIRHSMERLDKLPHEERSKVYFIHLNHTNPAADPDSEAYREIIDRGYRIGIRGQRFSL